MIQSTGIILSAYAVNVGSPSLTWAGISLNMCASLLNIYENQNNIILKKLMGDIIQIKNDTYVDECALVTEKEKEIVLS